MGPLADVAGISGFPDVTVAVELDNAVHGDWPDVLAAMRSIGVSLCRARAERNVTIDVVVMADDSEAARRAGDEILSTAEDSVGHLTQRVLPEATYFEKKEIAAVEATSGIVLFADCDCWYEPDWAVALIDALSDEGVHMASGRSFARLAGASRQQRAAGLVWIFPVPDGRDPRLRSTQRFANNFGVRAPLMRNVTMRRFSSYRGQGHQWLREVDHSGTPSVFVESARSFHRQPNGILELMVRGWHHGEDREADLRQQSRSRASRALRVLPGATKGTAKSLGTIIGVGSPTCSPSDRMRALVYLLAFQSSLCAGQIVAWWRP